MLEVGSCLDGLTAHTEWHVKYDRLPYDSDDGKVIKPMRKLPASSCFNRDLLTCRCR